jgi:hypothetical protein
MRVLSKRTKVLKGYALFNEDTKEWNALRVFDLRWRAFLEEKDAKEWLAGKVGMCK